MTRPPDENPTTWFVKATVTAQIKARGQGEAMQELCDRLVRGDERGAPFDYEVNTVDAERISLPLPTAESEAAVDELLRLAEAPDRGRSDA